MADRLQIKKRAREEYEGNFISRPPPRIATNTSALATYFYPLRMRELGKNMKLPHIYIYRDYHVQSFGHIGMGTVQFMVTGADIILVVHSFKDLVLFKRQGDQISPVHCNTNRSISALRVKGFVQTVCYNKHNNSFLIAHRVYHKKWQCDGVEIISLDIAAIKEGESLKTTRLFPGESHVKEWCFDIPNCRAIIHDLRHHSLKCCELKEYTLLFAITNLGFTNVRPGSIRISSNLKTTSPGNMDMMIYEQISSTKSNGRVGVELKIYSKLNGILQKEIFLPRTTAEEIIQFVVLCDSNTLLIQQYSSQIEVVEICGENPVSINIRNTNISAVSEPYYLYKRSQFICCTESGKIQVCNLHGEILVTLEDHPLAEWPVLDSANIFRHSYIFNSQDIIISLCCRRLRAPSGERSIYSVNVSSIVTGKCLAKISSEDPNCSKIRKAVLNDAVRAFAFDEGTHEIFTGNDGGLCGVWSNDFYKDEGDVRS